MKAQLESQIYQRQEHHHGEHTDDGRCVGSEPHQASRNANNEIGSEASDARSEHQDGVAERTRQRAPCIVNVPLNTLDCIVCVLHDIKLRATAQICRSARWTLIAECDSLHA